MRRALYVLSLVNLVAVVSLAAQQVNPRFVRWEPPAVPLARLERWEANQRDTVLVPRHDYRYEGLAFGGIVFGAAGAWLGWNLGVSCPTVPGAECGRDRLGNAVTVGLVGAALGGGLGYLVGRFSSKPSPNQVSAVEPLHPSLIPDSTRRRVGYHHWKGAAIGAGGGALLMALLYLSVGDSCYDCEGGRSHFLEAELVGAGVGGALGFLVGLGSPKYESRPGETTPE